MRTGNKKDNIPKGVYCYKLISFDFSQGRISSKIEPCPYWELREDKPYQENGYCHYLKAGDWEENGTMFLFDQVKECGVNLREDVDENWFKKLIQRIKDEWQNFKDFFGKIFL